MKPWPWPDDNEMSSNSSSPNKLHCLESVLYIVSFLTLRSNEKKNKYFSISGKQEISINKGIEWMLREKNRTFFYNVTFFEIIGIPMSQWQTLVFWKLEHAFSSKVG